MSGLPPFAHPREHVEGWSGAMFAVHWTLRILRVGENTLQRRWERNARRFEGSGGEVFGDFSTRDPRHWAIRRDEFSRWRTCPSKTSLCAFHPRMTLFSRVPATADADGNLLGRRRPRDVQIPRASWTVFHWRLLHHRGSRHGTDRPTRAATGVRARCFSPKS